MVSIDQVSWNFLEANDVTYCLRTRNQTCSVPYVISSLRDYQCAVVFMSRCFRPKFMFTMKLCSAITKKIKAITMYSSVTVEHDPKENQTVIELSNVEPSEVHRTLSLRKSSFVEIYRSRH